MKNITLTLLLILITLQISGQNNCQIEESLEDLNKISKCSVSTDNRKSKLSRKSILKVKVSTSKKRYLQLKNQSSKKINFLVNSLSEKEIKSAKKFIQVDNIPTFDKCKNLKGEETINCFQSEMIAHINKYFYYPTDAVNKNIESSIWVRFIINSEGKVGNIKTIGNANLDTSQLEQVAKYVVAKLPVFKPAIKDGKPISVKYGFPINFSLEE